jgi:dolichol-phosphate mannosyltransferase
MSQEILIIKNIEATRIREFPKYTNDSLSIIIPTFNEAKNIFKLIRNVQKALSSTSIVAELIVVDDNSPDGTGRIVDEYIQQIKNSKLLQSDVKVIHKSVKNGLVSAILEGIASSSADFILVMDADFSHPPELISKMFDEIRNSNVDIVVASRYMKGGSIIGWPLKRRLISKGAVKIAQHILGMGRISDPMSGFFAFNRNIIENIKIDTAGYKILLEILVKANNARIKEIPYTFTDRQNGESKFGSSIILDYVKAVGHLYGYKEEQKQKKHQQQKQSSKQFAQYITRRKALFSFISQPAKFIAVGASGILINYLTAFLLSSGTLSSLWYVKATLVGILLSLTSNFILNKVWTFEDKDFSIRHTIRQYGFFAAISSIGAAIQLGLVYALVESGALRYDFALITAVAIASISNFILNKKLTFKHLTFKIKHESDAHCLNR